MSFILGTHAAVKTANFFMFQFHLLEHEIYFLKEKFEFSSEVGENEALPSTGRAKH